MGLARLALALFFYCLTGYGDDALSKATIVVYNSNFPESRSLADYYTSKRGIPNEQVIGLDCPKTEDIEREQYAFAESAYASLPCVSWMTTIVGDPLYRPFPNPPGSEQPSNPWAIIRSLFEKDRHDQAALVRDLTELGSHFPAALEVLGLVQAREHDQNAALATLETAKKAYGHEPEKFRCVLDQAEILQSQGRANQLAELIHKALDMFKATEQQGILKSYLR